MTTIKVLKNGPYLVEGDDVTVNDWNSQGYAIAKRPFYLGLPVIEWVLSGSGRRFESGFHGL
jgi:hypothetical protein